MKLFTACQIGAYHLNHCEDYLITAEIGNDKLLCAVMDGCTMGADSYFVSTFVGKLLKKISKSLGYQEFYGLTQAARSLDDLLHDILKDLFAGLLQLKSQLLLEQNDLLTTLLILLIDKKENKGLLLVVGDGVVSINGIVTEFDQDNKPDYLGFHLQTDFDAWFTSQKQKIHIDDISDIGLATDGISLFDRFSAPTTDEEIDPLHFLLKDKTNLDKDDMLERKLKTLEHVHGLQPTDDLAVIRIVRT